MFIHQILHTVYHILCTIYYVLWVVVKIRVPFWVLSTIRHLVFRGPKRDIILTTTHIPYTIHC